MDRYHLSVRVFLVFIISRFFSDNYNNFRVVSISLISNLNLKNEIKVGIVLNPQIFQKYQKTIPDDSQMDPECTNENLKACGILKKITLHYPRSGNSPWSPTNAEQMSPNMKKDKTCCQTVAKHVENIEKMGPKNPEDPSVRNSWKSWISDSYLPKHMKWKLVIF